MEDFMKRMLNEHSELSERIHKLEAALAKDGFSETVQVNEGASTGHGNVLQGSDFKNG